MKTAQHRPAAIRLLAIAVLLCFFAAFPPFGGGARTANGGAGLVCGGAEVVYAAEAADAAESADAADEAEIAAIVDGMTLDEKISQMIIPSVRQWNGSGVTDLGASPEMAEALQRHQYGGLILFDQNIQSAEQTAALTAALQENNANGGASTPIPYLMTVDAEGGLVMRIRGGTRMPGNMAIGAAGEMGRYDAYAAGVITGEELCALGFNVDFAPDIDINSDPSNPVIGVRSFSDDPELVALLGYCYGNGLRSCGVVPTYKHFPGHGDTGVDSHIGTPSISKTYEELAATELIPFEAAIDSGADMIMTAHITFPAIDEEVPFANGKTGYYPATMSKKIITDILRGDLGFEGVIISDGLEMEAIDGAGLVPGSGTEYRINVAEKVIGAGVDMLLIPQELNDADSAAFYDAYIAGLVKKVESGAISEERIDESVTRILTLKQKYGILAYGAENDQNADAGDADADADAAEAASPADIVGSDEHRAFEKKIALHGVTLVKNDDVLPLVSTGAADADGAGTDEAGAEAADAAGTGATNVVILGGSEAEVAAIENEIAALREQGVISEETSITVGTYYDNASQSFACSEACLAAAEQADAAIVFCSTMSDSSLHDLSSQSQAVSAMKNALPEGGKLIVVSGALPYDAARYQEADAIVLAYMGAGLDSDTTGEKTDASAGYNANTAAALDVIFGAENPHGKLPVAIPAVSANGDGSYSYSDEILYERGFGLTY